MSYQANIDGKIFAGYSEDCIEIITEKAAIINPIRIYNIYFIQEGALTGWSLNSHASSGHHRLFCTGMRVSTKPMIIDAEKEILMSIAGDIYSRSCDHDYSEFGKLFPLMELEYWNEFLKLKRNRDSFIFRKKIPETHFREISEGLPAFSSKGISLFTELIFFNEDIFNNPGYQHE
jgi:hypothetical protein